MIQEVYVKTMARLSTQFSSAGAGFAYLGKWTWAILNLAGAIAIDLLVYRFSPDSLSIASTAVAAASGSLAMIAAKTMNAKFISSNPLRRLRAAKETEVDSARIVRTVASFLSHPNYFCTCTWFGAVATISGIPR